MIPACNHIYAAIIYVSYQETGAMQQYSRRHGMGHALGLGHSYECTVMYEYFCSLYVNQHDRDAMWWMYSSPRLGLAGHLWPEAVRGVRSEAHRPDPLPDIG